MEAVDQVGQLGIRLVLAQLVRHLVRHGHDRRRVVGQRRLGHQDLELAALEPLDDLGRRLPLGKLVEELLDVPDLERALLEWVFPNQIVRGIDIGAESG